MKIAIDMKHNKLVWMAMTFVLGFALFGCKKDNPETLTPKITDDKVEATTTSATFTWKVEWIGNRISVVELSERMDMSDSHFFGSEEELNKEVFTVLVEDLKPGTKYYYRYWVWNHNYENNKFVMETNNFTTKTDKAVVKTLEVTDITRTSATGQGEILSDGGLEITERGICWGTSLNPTTSDNHAASSQSTTTFSVPMTNLTPEETYYVRAYAKNAKGTAYSENEMWFVTGDAVPPTVTTAQVTDISWRTAIGGGEVTEDGDAMVTERGICWSTSANPTIDDSYTGSGSGTGSFTADITSLTAGTTYHVRAYAKNRAGYGYGDDVTFKTTDAVTPTVTTTNPTDITRTSAICGGDVTGDGGSDITERGVCWGTDSNLSISGNHLAADENGVGTFTVQITGLTPNTSYYVCSYATNSAGTSYGTPKSFATSPIGKPTVTTAQVSNITTTTASGGGNVTDDGGAEVTERGICWSTEHNPTLESCIGNAHSGTGTGEYTLNMTSLIQGTKYYVRAYAKNNVGTSYGEEVYFTTSIQYYTISVVADPIYGGQVTGGGTYSQGQTITITAMAYGGSDFVNWTENDIEISCNESYTFTVNEDRTLMAHFTIQANLPDAIDFNAIGCFGNSVHLYDILDQGQAVLIAFLLCGDEFSDAIMQYVTESYRFFGCNMHDVYFLGVCPNSNNANCQNWCQTFGVEFPIISGAAGGSGICNSYQIGYYPMVVLILPNRKIVIQDLYPINNTQVIISALESYGINQNECSKNLKNKP